MIDSRRNLPFRVLVPERNADLLASGVGKDPLIIPRNPKRMLSPPEDALTNGVPDSTDQTDTEDTLTDASKPEIDDDTVSSSEAWKSIAKRARERRKRA